MLLKDYANMQGSLYPNLSLLRAIKTRVDINIKIEFVEEGNKVKFIRFYNVFIDFYRFYATAYYENKVN